MDTDRPKGGSTARVRLINSLKIPRVRPENDKVFRRECAWVVHVFAANWLRLINPVDLCNCRALEELLVWLNDRYPHHSRQGS